MTDQWHPPSELTRVARLDEDRRARRGIAEAVLCAGKSAAQLRVIAAEVAATQASTLFTRIEPSQVEAVRASLPDAAHHPDANLLAWPGEPPTPSGGEVLVVTAGTSDLPVAYEATLTAQHLGRRTALVADVGVAGLHRILSHLDELRSADVIIVVAGMDGALASVVAGLVEVPVVAVPTSTGYGAAFGGMSALLGMLNACSPGVAVVNIDNGYGAGHLAAQITTPRPA